MKVRVDIDHGEESNDEGFETPTTTATCSKCGHQTFSWGDGPDSERRCLALLREECPRKERNWYEEG